MIYRVLDLEGRVGLSKDVPEPEISRAELNTLYEVMDGRTHLALPIGDAALVRTVYQRIERSHYPLTLQGAFLAGSDTAHTGVLWPGANSGAVDLDMTFLNNTELSHRALAVRYTEALARLGITELSGGPFIQRLERDGTRVASAVATLYTPANRPPDFNFDVLYVPRSAIEELGPNMEQTQEYSVLTAAYIAYHGVAMQN